LVLLFWYRLTWVLPEKGPLYGCILLLTVGTVLFGQLDLVLNFEENLEEERIQCCHNNNKLTDIIGFKNNASYPTARMQKWQIVGPPRGLKENYIFKNH